MRAVVMRVRGALRRGWPPVVAVAGIVAIVSGAVFTLAAGARRTARAPAAYTRSVGGNADGLVQQRTGNPRTAEIAKLPGVKSISAMTFLFVGVIGADGEGDESAIGFAGTQPFGSRLVAGRTTDATKPHEFIADQAFAARQHLRIGDRVHVVSWSRQQGEQGRAFQDEPKGPGFDGELVGIIDSPGQLEDTYSTLVFSPALLREDVGLVATIAGVHLQPGVTTAEFRAQLDSLPGGQALSLDPGQVVSAEIRNAVDAQARGTWLMAIVVGVAALIALGQLLTRHARLAAGEQRPLTAVGYTKGQLLGESLTRAAVPAVAGTLVGVAIATALSGQFPAGFVRALEPNPGISSDVSTPVISAIVLLAGLLVWVSVALLATRRRSALRPPSITRETIIKGAPSPTAAIGARFALTSRVGSAVGTLVVLTIIVAGMVGSTSFAASLDRLVTDPARFGSNYTFGLGDNSDLSAGQLRKALTGDPDVAAIMILSEAQGRAGNKTIGLVGVERVRGQLAPSVLAGHLPEAPDEVALGRVTARDLSLRIGDDVEIAVDPKRGRFHVVGYTVVPTVGGNDGVGAGAVLTADGLARLTSEPISTLAGVRLGAGAPPGTRERISKSLDVATGQESKPGVIVNVARVRRVPGFLAGLLAALLLMTLLHAVIVSIQTRRRDLAILGALGADRGWIGRAVHWQATLLIALPLIVGVPLGIVVGSVVFRAFVDRIGAVPDPAWPIALVTGLALALVALANLVAIVPIRRARRRSTAAQLQAE